MERRRPAMWTALDFSGRAPGGLPRCSQTLLQWNIQTDGSQRRLPGVDSGLGQTVIPSLYISGEGGSYSPQPRTSADRVSSLTHHPHPLDGLAAGYRAGRRTGGLFSLTVHPFGLMRPVGPHTYPGRLLVP